MMTAGKLAGGLWWTNRFSPISISLHVALHTHMSSEGWTVGSLVVAVQRRGPTPLIRITTGTWLPLLLWLVTAFTCGTQTTMMLLPPCANVKFWWTCQNCYAVYTFLTCEILGCYGGLCEDDNNNNVGSSIRNIGCLQIFSSLLGSWR
jgi:hypothetical protein